VFARCTRPLGSIKIRPSPYTSRKNRLVLAWTQVVERSYEGYVSKDEASAYEGGPTRRWLKVKQKGWVVEERSVAAADLRVVGCCSAPPWGPRHGPALFVGGHIHPPLGTSSWGLNEHPEICHVGLGRHAEPWDAWPVHRPRRVGVLHGRRRRAALAVEQEPATALARAAMSAYDPYGQREFDTRTESSPGPHIVTHPTRGPHVEPRAGSVILLLMDTLVAHRLGRRLVLYEPLAPVRVCGDCQAAFGLARSVVENAGGVQAWAEQVSRREALDGDLALDELLGRRR
jgi:hypothetical protein